MNKKENYGAYTEGVIKELSEKNEKKRLLLHVCCAPCSSYVLEYLHEHFDITVFFYNPNIDLESEYRLRADEEQRLIREMGLSDSVRYTEGEYVPADFYAAAKGLEGLPEGGERCTRCFELRLEAAARAARDGKFDFFTTTLSISPLKDSVRLNEIGRRLSEKYGVAYLFSDFKKKNGYKRSVELSHEYSLYRQSYCGCSFSLAQAKREGRA